MKYFVVILLVLVFSCKESPNEVVENREVTKNIVNEIELEIYDYNGIEKFLNIEDGKTYVVNFWATWCAPCVKELPYFEKLGENYNNKDVKVILISLDFPKHFESNLKPFIKKNDLQSRVLVLDDSDMNAWIPRVNENWEGAIPATLIYNKDKREFYEQSFNYEELKTEVDKFLN